MYALLNPDHRMISRVLSNFEILSLPLMIRSMFALWNPGALCSQHPGT